MTHMNEQDNVNAVFDNANEITLTNLFLNQGLYNDVNNIISKYLIGCNFCDKKLIHSDCDDGYDGEHDLFFNYMKSGDDKYICNQCKNKSEKKIGKLVFGDTYAQGFGYFENGYCIDRVLYQYLNYDMK